MYVIAALQFGTVFVLAAIFWAGPIIAHLRGPRAAPRPRRVSLRPADPRAPAASY